MSTKFVSIKSVTTGSTYDLKKIKVESGYEIEKCTYYSGVEACLVRLDNFNQYTIDVVHEKGCKKLSLGDYIEFVVKNKKLFNLTRKKLSVHGVSKSRNGVYTINASEYSLPANTYLHYLPPPTCLHLPASTKTKTKKAYKKA